MQYVKSAKHLKAFNDSQNETFEAQIANQNVLRMLHWGNEK